MKYLLILFAIIIVGCSESPVEPIPLTTEQLLIGGYWHADKSEEWGVDTFYYFRENGIGGCIAVYYTNGEYFESINPWNCHWRIIKEGQIIFIVIKYDDYDTNTSWVKIIKLTKNILILDDIGDGTIFHKQDYYLPQ